MIDTLTLRNWECHESLVVEFDNITVLIGDNDCGKTAILHALLFVMFNVWEGKANSHVTWGKDYSEITLEVEDHTITRIKGEKVNHYILDGEKFEVVQSGKVPDKIATILNSGADNVQKQGDPAFWLSLTAGKAASALNEIFNLELIDLALSKIGSELNRAKTEHTAANNRLNEASREKTKLHWVPTAFAAMEELGTLEEKIHLLSRKIKQKTKLIEQMEEAQGLESLLERTIEQGEETLELGLKWRKIEERTWKLKKIQGLMTDLSETNSILKRKERELSDALADTCPLCGRK